jgi:hypothetical protein
MVTQVAATAPGMMALQKTGKYKEKLSNQLNISYRIVHGLFGLIYVKRVVCFYLRALPSPFTHI